MGFSKRHTASQSKRKRLRKDAVQRAAKRGHKRAVKIAACVVIGVLLLLLALVVGDASYHATPIGWVPFLCYLLLVIGAWGYLQLLKRAISFEEQVEASACKRGAEVPFRVFLHNRGVLFFFRIEVVITAKDLFGNTTSRVETVAALGPKGSSELCFNIAFDHVGRYQAGVESLVISDFLGLFTHSVPNKRAKTICVSPNIYQVSSMDFSEEALEDSDKASKAVLADSMDYAYVREYVPGDPLKTIHWKLSAKAGEYMTRLFEVYTNPAVAVFMDFYAPLDDADDLMGVYDAVIESGFTVARYAQQEGMDTAMRYVNRYAQSVELNDWSDDAVQRFVEDAPTASNSAQQASLAIDLIRSCTSGSYGENNIVVCSANFSPELMEALVSAKLNGRNPLLIAIVPLSLVDRDRDDYCRPLQQLQLAGIDCMIVSRAQEMRGVVA